VWGDTTAAEQSSINALDAYAGFDGDVDVSIGGLVAGESWSAAASGAYVERWRSALRAVAAKRAGKSGAVFLRFAHEMNGTWYPWTVTSGNVNDFHAAWRLFYGLVRSEYPAARVVFSPNNDTVTDVPVGQIWPGDDVVDVVGVDYYDGYPAVTDAGVWASVVNATEGGGQPYGPGAWQAFAVAHGKPLAFPEWGLRSGDHPEFVQGMHDFFAAHAAGAAGSSLAGKVIYDVYFDIANSGNTGFMLTGGANPAGAARYKSLSWGS
jgi:beta-mannanase